MDDNAIEILDTQRTMAISTLRADGWPQTTIVGYANDGLTLYFLIFRSSQKLANIRRDKRISIAVGGDPKELDQLMAVYAAAHASRSRIPKSASGHGVCSRSAIPTWPISSCRHQLTQQ